MKITLTQKINVDEMDSAKAHDIAIELEYRARTGIKQYFDTYKEPLTDLESDYEYR